jgi:hypothetical protein
MTPIYKMVDGVEIALTEEEIAEWVALQEEAPLAQWAEIRAERNAKLAACDWTQLPDAPADTAAWATYRQELRDITTQNDPFDIIWPSLPEGTEA